MTVRAAAAARTAALIAAAATAGAAGLRVAPRPFPDYPAAPLPPTGHVPVPAGLPAPVERWLRGVYGPQLPIIESIVVTGRARLKPFGIWLPARFRFTHDAGRGYRHYLEATWYGVPVLKVNERFIDGQSLIEIPLIGTDSGPKVQQAANLGMWAELAAAAPAVLATDPRVSWRPIDAQHATLVVPLADGGTDELTARFDPVSGGLRAMQGWRYRSSAEASKVLWITESMPGPLIPGTLLPAVGTATWVDQGGPWARFITDDARINVDIATYLRAHGV